ncbi:MAG: abortive infection system antitoxin AbiGi family protein [Candidatus Theseobacter exili]|nr:abortive infection system antitoxin AbiGi family protein [Candidatus Theseobacter exili]
MKEKINNSLYPDILFHFTTKDGLFSILQKTFKVSYAREKIEGKSSVREFGVPMISFCDLKLSEHKVHMNKYGKYGIGLKKEWANRQGLNPVLYVNKHSEFADNFNAALNGIYRHMNKLRDGEHFRGLSEDYMKIFDTYRYIKNYEGLLKRNGKKINNFRFADEREWRYVPPINHPDVQPFVPISNIKTKKQKDVYNQKIDGIRLSFQPNDIKYLIIDNDEEINGLISYLRKVKGRFDKATIDRLSSRILTAEQIHNDV